jgi:hypothetical protein
MCDLIDDFGVERLQALRFGAPVRVGQRGQLILCGVLVSILCQCQYGVSISVVSVTCSPAGSAHPVCVYVCVYVCVCVLICV